MQVILILAGRSTRFWPLSEKSFFPIAGTTLIETQIARLKEAGLKDITLVTGAHNKVETKKLFPKLTIVEQKDLDLGMRGALLSALPKMKKGPVLIVSANDVIESDAYTTLRERGMKLSAGGLILARKVKTYFPGGYLTVRRGKIEGIVEKPKPGTEPSDLINLVAHVHADPGALLSTLKEQKAGTDDGYERALAELFKEHEYKAVPYTGKWQAVKFPWHLLDLVPHLLPSQKSPIIHKTAKVHKSAVIEGSVVLGPNVQVFAHASVIGPCVIGEGTIIGNNALVRESSVGKNCVIGYNTEVARSVVANDVWTHSSYIGDSVVGSNVSFGAGSVTGNLRLDEREITSVIKGDKTPTGRVKLGSVFGEGCRMGIHTSFAPGVKIGKGTFISSDILITSDIPDDSYVTEKNGTVDIRKNNQGEMKSDRTAFRKVL
jgi:UDP-N-acetylglucosamine diphosphorylase / glucose-1-phosphate thymidylyltransferase / UDP-N-acetylgalactosamine diphosphorylase / glucosamine-1-phosphate N-acetyltransferase / galactosamine-1-phosphate N-acetyltransferase